jgi:CubicO group peptidase (beta-lactamase class C family)
MRRLAFILSLLLAVQVSAVPNTTFSDAQVEAIQTFLQGNLAGGNAGMVIGLVDENGERVFGAGKLDNGTNSQVDGDTVFEIGSTTKVFTSLLALDMDRRGEVKLDDSVAKYLPEWVKVPAFEGKQITLAHLAAQDSGLPWNPDDLDRILNRNPQQPALKEFFNACNAYTTEDLYAFLARHKLTADLGARFQYSNVGMALLGHAMALTAGESYESLVVSRIARPLKMDSTGVTLTPDMKARLARGHWADGTPSSENLNLQVTASAGALLSTANDLLKFLSANLGWTQSELTPLMEKMQVVRHTDDPQFGNTAMPWVDDRVYQPPGSEMLGHGGAGVGYLAFIGLDKKKRRGVVVLSNQMTLNPSGIGWAILQGMPLSRPNITFLVREIVGLGVALESDEKTGEVRITNVYPQSPAGRGGLVAGQVIETINDVPVAGRNLQDCLRMIGGPVGTPVRLGILAPVRTETNIVEVTRQKFLTTTE